MKVWTCGLKVMKRDGALCLMRRRMKEGVKAALAIAEKVGGKELCRQLRLAEVATYAERVRPQAGEALCEVIGGLLQMVAWPAGGETPRV